MSGLEREFLHGLIRRDGLPKVVQSIRGFYKHHLLVARSMHSRDNIKALRCERIMEAIGQFAGAIEAAAEPVEQQQ